MKYTIICFITMAPGISLSLITSAKEVMFSLPFVCLSVCFSDSSIEQKVKGQFSSNLVGKKITFSFCQSFLPGMNLALAEDIFSTSALLVLFN